MAPWAGVTMAPVPHSATRTALLPPVPGWKRCMTNLMWGSLHPAISKCVSYNQSCTKVAYRNRLVCSCLLPTYCNVPSLPTVTGRYCSAPLLPPVLSASAAPPACSAASAPSAAARPPSPSSSATPRWK